MARPNGWTTWWRWTTWSHRHKYLSHFPCYNNINNNNIHNNRTNSSITLDSWTKSVINGMMLNISNKKKQRQTYSQYVFWMERLPCQKLRVHRRMQLHLFWLLSLLSGYEAYSTNFMTHLPLKNSLLIMASWLANFIQMAGRSGRVIVRRRWNALLW